MNSKSPHYQFDPDSIGWLHRRHNNDEEVRPGDLERLLTADPAYGADPVMNSYLLEHLGGRLKLRRGPKPRGVFFNARLMVAEDVIKERAAQIKAECKGIDRNSQRSQLEPCVEAANQVGPWLGLPGGRALLNLISALKNPKNDVKASAVNS
jgi:hypothetical protein